MRMKWTHPRAKAQWRSIFTTTFNDKKTKIILCYRFGMNLNLVMQYLLTLNSNFLTFKSSHTSPPGSFLLQPNLCFWPLNSQTAGSKSCSRAVWNRIQTETYCHCARAFPYLLHEPPPSPPGQAPSPGSSSSSSHVWTGSTATCLRAAPPRSQTSTGTTTPLTAHFWRTARWRRSARWEYHRPTTPSHFRAERARGRREVRTDGRIDGRMDGWMGSGAVGEGEERRSKGWVEERKIEFWKKYALYNS